jgi:hypothetical protein
MLPFPPAACGKAPLAQLDRASDYESEGREFESLRVHFFFSPPACFLGRDVMLKNFYNLLKISELWLFR